MEGEAMKGAAASEGKKGERPEALGTLKPTANRTGFDMGVPTFRWEAWAEAHAAAEGDRLLDVGSGLGTNALAALTDRGRAVVAVDPSPNHLERLREAASEAGVPAGRLTTVQGELPDLPSEVAALGPYAGVLCAQVLHFMKPSLIPPAFRALYKMLAPGGRLVLTCASLYQLPPQSGLVEAMEQTLFEHAQHEEEEKDEDEAHWKEGELSSSPPPAHGPAAFPGWILDTRARARGHKDDQADKLQREAMPDSLHVFHPVQIRYQAEQAGFNVEECDFVPGRLCGLPPEFTNEGGPGAGKENVYLVATKKETGQGH